MTGESYSKPHLPSPPLFIDQLHYATVTNHSNFLLARFEVKKVEEARKFTGLPVSLLLINYLQYLINLLL